MPVDEDFYDKLFAEVTDAMNGLSLGFSGDDEEEDEFLEVSAQPKDDAEAVIIFILYIYW